MSESVAKRCRRLAAISIDLDETHHYRAIHGLPPSEEAAHAAYDVAIVRAVEFARSFGAPITFFAVGDDLARSRSAETIERVAGLGHAVESHSMSHRYDLTRCSPSEIHDEIVSSFDAIERVAGRRPQGFRAPGYTMSDDVLDALEDAGATFDSSIFPSPPYYAAKVAVLGFLALAGRASASVIGSPRALWAPTEPYRPGQRHHARGDRGLIEIPIRVTHGLRFPVIGSTVGLFGERFARSLVKACGSVDVFNLELHAIDFLDASDGLDDLVPHVAELRVPRQKRLAAFGALLRALVERGFSFTTLAEIAAQSGGL